MCGVESDHLIPNHTYSTISKPPPSQFRNVHIFFFFDFKPLPCFPWHVCRYYPYNLKIMELQDLCAAPSETDQDRQKVNPLPSLPTPPSFLHWPDPETGTNLHCIFCSVLLPSLWPALLSRFSMLMEIKNPKIGIFLWH